MDPIPDSDIFVIELQDANKKIIDQKSFSSYYFLKVHLHHLSKIKSPILLFLLADRRIRIRIHTSD